MSLTVTGIIFLWKNSTPDGGTWTPSAVNFGYPAFLTSLFLNVLLTLMIIVRLVLHNRNIKKAMGTQSTTSGLYKTIVTMFVESFALYTVIFLLFIGTWGAKSYFVYTFFPILVETQVRATFAILGYLSDHADEQTIAPLLIITRVVNRSASTSSITSLPKNTGPIRFRSQWEEAGRYGTLVDEDPMRSVGAHEETASEICLETINENSPRQV